MKVYDPIFSPTAHLYKLLEQISAVRERVQNSLIKVPWVPSLVIEARARLAWGSTAIEGCTLSLEAVQGLLEGKDAIGYPDRHVQIDRFQRRGPGVFNLGTHPSRSEATKLFSYT